MTELMSEARQRKQRDHSEAIIIDHVTENIKAETYSGDSGSQKGGII